MMYIDGMLNGRQVTSQWHVGEKITSNHVANATCIQADGDELEYIKNHFSGIPMHDGRVVRWYGEFALFIGDGLWQRHK